MEEPIIGQNYEILDSLGMVSFQAKFIGIGHEYNSYDGKIYYKEFKGYYVFERNIEEFGNYKYCACLPVSNGVKFSHFVTHRYGMDLNHLFVNFKQPYFTLGYEHSVIPSKRFNLKYNKNKQNSGEKGYFLDK